MINIVLDPANLYRCCSLATLLPGYEEFVDAAVLAPRAITVKPRIDKPSDIRDVQWRLGLPLIASDKGTRDEVIDVLGKLIGAAGFFAGAAAGLAAAGATAALTPITIKTAQDAIDRAGALMNDIEAALEDGSAEANLDFVGLNVVFDPSRAAAGLRDAWYGFQVFLYADWRRPKREEGEANSGENRCIVLEHFEGPDYGRAHRSVDGQHIGRYGDVGGGVLSSSLCRATGRLGEPLSLDQDVTFKLHCDIDVDAGTFVTLIESVKLRIVAGTQARVYAALRLPPPPAVALPDDAPSAPAPAPAPAPAAPPPPGQPGALSVPPLVIPANDSARKLVAEIVEGRVRHLGLHLSTLPRAELKRIAVGLGAEAATATDDVALAKEIARRLVPGAG